MTDWGPAVREYEEFASEYRGSLLGTGECVRKADAAIAELKAEVNQAYDDGESSGYAEWVGEMIDAGLPDNPHAVVAAKESFYARIIELEAEIERLTQVIIHRKDRAGAAISFWAQRAEKAEAEAERLTWMVHHLPLNVEADLARRWEERRDPEVGA